MPVSNILCKGERIKQLCTFKYLISTITPYARCDIEIQKRIALSKDIFTKMKSIFTNRNIRLSTKINTMKAYIWSILLYGCECWTLTKDLERRLKQQKCCISEELREYHGLKGIQAKK
ncbi:craniofacial development protein 2 [Plakobranchus ocellatus]|uniref:Craniofacial development protein 2 n=1 Tax=Plakobranchus ocellatus TaxID=259542 RepID=A0AAV3YHS0_9GAST|nr:craniofacial development protein 2 [Plakobranchus ocellatus]